MSGRDCFGVSWEPDVINMGAAAPRLAGEPSPAG